MAFHQRRAFSLLAALLCVACYPDPQKVRVRDQQFFDSSVAGAGGAGGEGGAGGFASDASPDDSASPADRAEDLRRADDAPGGSGPDAVSSLDAPDAGAADLPRDLAPDASFDRPPDLLTVERRCTDYAQNLCATFARCDPFDLARTYGDEAKCRTQVKISCDLADLPGSNWPSKACADGYLGLSCSNFRNNLDPLDCQAPGQLLDGASCADETQCQGRRCLIAAGATCGVCRSKQPTGASCFSDQSCQRNLVCSSKGVAMGTCVTPGTLNADCGDTQPCLAELTCTAGKCVARGTDGVPCTDSRDCDVFTGFGCSGAVGASVCRKFTIATDTCRVNPDGTFESCAALGVCKVDSYTCLYASSVDGVCTNTADGPHCLLPAFCNGGGKCQLPDLKNACH